MQDPFQDVESGGEEFIQSLVVALERRGAEPAMLAIIDAYLDKIPFPDGGVHVEVGAGTGCVSRRFAERAANGQVIAQDPSAGLIAAGRELARGVGNLTLETGDGTSLRFEDSSVDTVLFHTVLSHVTDPAKLLAEAGRVLKPGASLVICDADFSKTSVANAIGDPMQACADFFAENFVTDKYLVARLRDLVRDAGFDMRSFEVTSRIITDTDGGMTWVDLGGKVMVKTGLIGQGLADAMVAEYARRRDGGKLYGHLPFATLIATR